MRPLYVRWGRCTYCLRWYSLTMANMVREHQVINDGEVSNAGYHRDGKDYCRGGALTPSETSYEERKPRK